MVFGKQHKKAGTFILKGFSIVFYHFKYKLGGIYIYRKTIFLEI